jgi:predicted dinucleotide-binding enzyme
MRAMTEMFCLSRRRLLDGLAAALILAPASSALAQGPLKIATIGSGNEGGALGTIFAKLGHPVMFSSRHPEELKDLVAAAGPNARAGTVADAVAFGDVVFVVVPYSAVEQIGKDYGKALATKPLVVDVSNPSAARDGDTLAKWVDEQGGAGLATAKLLPGSHLVRAWNALGHNGLHGNEVLVKPTLTGPIGVPIAGDDPQAIAVAMKLFKETRFEPVLVGGLAMGKYLNSGLALSGEHTPDELRKIAAGLK